jgi:hypothetical protein
MARHLRADHPGGTSVLIPIPQGRLPLGGCGDLLGWPYFGYVWAETLATRSLRRSLRVFSSRVTVQTYQPSKEASPAASAAALDGLEKALPSARRIIQENPQP